MNSTFLCTMQMYVHVIQTLVCFFVVVFTLYNPLNRGWIGLAHTLCELFLGCHKQPRLCIIIISFFKQRKLFTFDFGPSLLVEIGVQSCNIA